MQGPRILGGLKFSSDPNLCLPGLLTRDGSTGLTTRAATNSSISRSEAGLWNTESEIALSLAECTRSLDQLGSTQCSGNNLLGHLGNLKNDLCLSEEKDEETRNRSYSLLRIANCLLDSRFQVRMLNPRGNTGYRQGRVRTRSRDILAFRRGHSGLCERGLPLLGECAGRCGAFP